MFKNKGLELLILKKYKKTVLVYAYRKAKLQNDLNKENVFAFLKQYGYKSVDADNCIKTLKSRLKESEQFPHEIGIFLGYPLGDVVGFIENTGKNSICSGCWKVYCNECEAIKTFAKYDKCKKSIKNCGLRDAAYQNSRLLHNKNIHLKGKNNGKISNSILERHRKYSRYGRQNF